MINLEWLRTFRSVYKTKSLSKTAEQLMISQPTVSQHIATLEAHIGKKLFTRKSKGVEETDDGKILNTLVSSSIESLENVEHLIHQKKSKLKNIITLGLSPHLFKALLCDNLQEVSDYIHLKFDLKQNLLKDVNEGNLRYAVIAEEINTFDTLCFPLFDQKLVIAATHDLDLSGLEEEYLENPSNVEKTLTSQKWYSHDSNSSFIKLFWLYAFDKKRPSIIPHYIIPNEYEVLLQLSKGSGLCIGSDNLINKFVKNGSLKKIELKEINWRKLYLIANKNKTEIETTKKLIELLKS